MSTPLSLLQLGTRGLNTSLAREALSLQQFPLMRNWRSFKGKLETAPGVTAFSTSTLAGRPLKLFAWQQDNLLQQFLALTTTKAYRYNPVTDVFDDITGGGGYTGGTSNWWDATAFAGQAILTNGVDALQVDAGAGALTALGGSPPGTAACLATFQTYLLAGATNASLRLVRWTDTGVATAWSGGDAGNLTLFQSPGPVYRLIPLGEACIAYRPTGIHVLFYVGSPFIFAQRQIYSTGGLIAPRAVADLGPRHIYWGTDNVYLFDGANRVPIATEIFQDMLDDVDPSFQSYIHAAIHWEQKEVYFFYPRTGDVGVASRAWVYNYAEQHWHQQVLTATASGEFRRFTSVTWAAAAGTWAGYPGTWNEPDWTDPAPILLVATDTGAVRFLDTDSVNIAGAARTRIAETGLIPVGAARFGQPGIKCTLQQIVVDLENKGTYNLEVWVGTQDSLTGDAGITWTQYTIISDGTVRFIDTRHTAVYFAFRLQTTGAGEAERVSGLTAYFSPRGTR